MYLCIFKKVQFKLCPKSHTVHYALIMHYVLFHLVLGYFVIQHHALNYHSYSEGQGLPDPEVQHSTLWVNVAYCNRNTHICTQGSYSYNQNGSISDTLLIIAK